MQDRLHPIDTLLAVTPEHLVSSKPLNQHERLLYRDRLRSARYAALADAESFQEICFAIEALGMRLHGSEKSINANEPHIKQLAA